MVNQKCVLDQSKMFWWIVKVNKGIRTYVAMKGCVSCIMIVMPSQFNTVVAIFKFILASSVIRSGSFSYNALQTYTLSDFSRCLVALHMPRMCWEDGRRDSNSY